MGHISDIPDFATEGLMKMRTSSQAKLRQWIQHQTCKLRLMDVDLLVTPPDNFVLEDIVRTVPDSV